MTDQSMAQAQRARGVLTLDAAVRDAATRLVDLRQEGCLRACFPTAEGAWMGISLLNTAGGIADGDRLSSRLVAGAGAHLVVASQAAERVYRARAGAAAAEVGMVLEVGVGARLEYLPQETILFEGCAMRRRLAVALAPGAAYLGVECLVFGRAASGERLRTARLDDGVEIWREGRLVLRDAVRLRGEVAPALRGRACAQGAGAAASLLYAAPDAAAMLEEVRAVLALYAGAWGVSVRAGVLVARLLGASSQDVRRGVVAALAVLRQNAPLPRVWGC